MSSDSQKVPMPPKVVQPPPGFAIPNSGLLNKAFCYGNVDLFGWVSEFILWLFKPGNLLQVYSGLMDSL